MSMLDGSINVGARCPGVSVQDILDQDQKPVPDALRLNSSVDLGTDDIAADRYTSREFHDLEMKHMWSRVWQMACRLEDVTENGDAIVYDIGDYSIIVVRGRDGVLRAFHNSCLHRGRQLVHEAAKLTQLRCPFHGFAWDLTGKLRTVPCRWDFPWIKDEEWGLPQVRLETWGGFVFVCLSDDTPPLSLFLSQLPEHFKTWPMDQRYKIAHVGKVLPCNWKIAQEAFMESFHVLATHPQIIQVTGDANTQYDTWPGEPHYTRMVTAQGVPSPHLGSNASDDKVIETYLRNRKVSPLGIPLVTNVRDLNVEEYALADDGRSARARLADALRIQLSEKSGVNLCEISDSEALDAIEYHIFPNLLPWAGFGSPTCYRVRPNGHDPDSCFFEVMTLMPFADSTPRPKGSPLRVLGPDENWTDATELGMLGHVVEQDMSNLPRLQRGLKASAKKTVTLANYQESRIRLYHQTIDKYISGEL
jgi:phenylpropionate dioxygenase-like ring-hydroxylating dioxygenase large terminal subunit